MRKTRPMRDRRGTRPKDSINFRGQRPALACGQCDKKGRRCEPSVLRSSSSQSGGPCEHGSCDRDHKIKVRLFLYSVEITKVVEPAGLGSRTIEIAVGPDSCPCLRWLTIFFHDGTVRSFAKINLGLCIGAARDDGFHELLTVYQTIGLHDVIRCECGARKWD